MFYKSSLIYTTAKKQEKLWKISIKEKKYPWGDVDFDLIELDKNSSKIPIYFRDNINYFDYLVTSEIEIPKKRNFIQKINQYFNFNS